MSPDYLDPLAQTRRTAFRLRAERLMRRGHTENCAYAIANDKPHRRHPCRCSKKGWNGARGIAGNGDRAKKAKRKAQKEARRRNR